MRISIVNETPIMYHCSVKGCKNKSDKYGRSNGVLFYAFPRNSALSTKWLKAVRRQSWVPSDSSKICSQHFDLDCFYEDEEGTKLLREESVPSLYLSLKMKPIKPCSVYIEENHELSRGCDGIIVKEENVTEELLHWDVSLLNEDKLKRRRENIIEHDAIKRNLEESKAVINTFEYLSETIERVIQLLKILIERDPDKVRGEKLKLEIMEVLSSYRISVEESLSKNETVREKLMSTAAEDIYEESRENLVSFVDVSEKRDRVIGLLKKKSKRTLRSSRRNIKESPVLEDFENDLRGLLKSDLELGDDSLEDYEEVSLNKKERNSRRLSSKKVEKELEDQNIDEVLDDKLVQRFTCQHCDISYVSSYYLPSHQRHCKGRRMRGLGSAPEGSTMDGSRIKCSVCEKVLSNRNNLRRHMILHMFPQLEPAKSEQDSSQPFIMTADTPLSTTIPRDILFHTIPGLPPVRTNLNEQVTILTNERDPNLTNEQNPNLTNEQHLNLTNEQVTSLSNEQKMKINPSTQERDIMVDKSILDNEGTILRNKTNMEHESDKQTNSLFINGIASDKMKKEANQSDSTNDSSKSKAISLTSKPKYSIASVVYDMTYKPRGTNEEYHCETCNEKFLTADSLEMHVHSIHEDDGRPLICNHCPQTFNKPLGLITHVKKCHKVKMTEGKNYYLASMQDLKDKNYPKEIDFKIYACKLCTNIFPTPRQLRDHQLKHNDFDTDISKLPQPRVRKKSDKKYPCSECGKIYLSSHGLWVHKHTHSNEEPFVCSYCGKRFKVRIYLHTHMKIHTSTNRYVCDICGATYTRANNLEKHKKSHSDVKAYKCHICSKAFKFTDSLRIHIRSHTGEKPWGCEICERRFTSKKQHIVHVNRHKGIRPYKCTSCDLAYFTNRELKKHRIKHLTHEVS